MKQKVAFFDIDGTLYRWSLFIEYTEAMLKEGVLPRQKLALAQEKLRLWQNRQISYEEYIKTLIQIFDDGIKNVDVDIFFKYVQNALKNKGSRVYVFTRELTKRLKKQGYFLVAISHSAKMAVDIFAKNYGFDKVYGLMFEIENNRFTGNILNKDLIFNKGKIVERFINKNPEFSLKDSIAIGDTESDIPMLEKVEHKIAFNPNKKLFDHATANKWNIVVERKDVIYKIQNEKIVHEFDFEKVIF